MGYGYGVWLIIEDEDWIKTNHVPHITIACFMKYEDAYCLYSDILDIMMTSLMEFKVIDKPVIFDDKMYPNDDNQLAAWGFNLECDCWHIFRAISIVYDCNFSPEPHTTIEYNKDKSLFDFKNSPLKTINCKLAVVNINSDNPNEWRKI